MIGGAWLCLAAPLAGALLITICGTRIARRTAAWLSTASVFVAFAGAVWSFFGLRSHGSEHGSISTAWTWLQSGGFKVGLEVLVDPLSTMMMLIVSGVGGLIVLYSIGYMHGDPEERRYFAYMSLFVFSMLLLVQGGNLLLLLAGWGMVGLSSYLLIGFWHERPSAIAAAKKAFVMNAIGDATMALALFLLIQHTGTLSFGALTGVGPSIASGSQVCSGSCADFATAPPSRPRATRFAIDEPCTAPRAPNDSVPVCWMRRKSASAIVASPNAFMMNAFFAAAIAAGRCWS